MAVVGVGRMGAFHARIIGDVPGLDVVAVADPNLEGARAVARSIGLSDAVGSARDLIDRADVEAWLIASPTPTHPELVDQAIDAGLHVLCEKPLSLEVDQSLSLGSKAESSGLVLQVGFWRRFSPPWVSAKELVESGAIGRPLMVRLSQWDADPPPSSFCDPEVSGGLAVDCGVHEFDLAEWLTGTAVESVSALGLPIVDPSIGEAGDLDNLVATLRLNGGAVATVDLSRNCRYGDDVRTEVLGEEGAIFVDILPTGRTRLATSTGVETVANSEVDDAVVAGVVAQAAAFVRCVGGGDGEVPGAEASARALATARAVQAASATGENVSLSRDVGSGS